MHFKVVAIALAVGALSGPALAEGGVAGRIASAFESLGMPAEQSACYGRTIDDELDREDGEKAASIVETAQSGDDVRRAVKSEGLDVMDAFMAAEDQCGS